MKRFYFVCILALSLLMAPTVMADHSLKSYQWQKRIILLFADTPMQGDYTAQQTILDNNAHSLAARDLVVIPVMKNDKGNEDLIAEYKPKQGFTFVLIGKDGGEKYRANSAVSIEQIENIIDSMPMRQQEMKDNTSTLDNDP